jgi:hypothetical protein
MAFIKDTTLKIEDILPFFPDFVVIDDFKDEICLALEEYTKDIDRLRTEMDEATKSAEAIKKDIGNLKNRFVTLEPGERCAHCSYQLFTRQFYVFPCQHSFHADCLIGMVRTLSSAITFCFHTDVVLTLDCSRSRNICQRMLYEKSCSYRQSWYKAPLTHPYKPGQMETPIPMPTPIHKPNHYLRLRGPSFLHNLTCRLVFPTLRTRQMRQMRLIMLHLVYLISLVYGQHPS